MAIYDDAIPVTLNSLGYTVLMTIRSDCPAETHSVVFADPEKLKPHTCKINARESSSYLAAKKRAAILGFEAARTEGHEFHPIVEPNTNPLPMAWVSCLQEGDGFRIGFTDGISRTTELIEQGAALVPLEVPTAEAHILHQFVGGSKMPVRASAYIAPPSVREGRWLAHPPSQRGLRPE